MVEREKNLSQESTEETFDLQESLQEELSLQIRNQLKSPEGLGAFENWRKLDEGGRLARQARKLTELLTASKALVLKHQGRPECQDAVKQHLKQVLNIDNISSLSRVEQFQSAIASEALDLGELEVKEEVRNFIQRLKIIQSTGGEVDAIKLISSLNVDFGLKKAWVESQFLSRFHLLNRKDLNDAGKLPSSPSLPAEPAEPKSPSPELPPEIQDFLRPSIDEMEKQEGEPNGYFEVAPFYGGYYEEQVFEEWDPVNLYFKARSKKYKEAEKAVIDRETERIMSGLIQGGEKVPLPKPYNFVFDGESLKTAGNENVKIWKDENGNYIVESSEKGVVAFNISLGKSLVKEERVEKEAETPKIQKIKTGKLSSETEEFLKSLTAEKISPLAKARKLRSYVKNLLEYPEKGDSKYNEIYYSEPSNFFQKIEQYKKADCDVGNAFFFALLSRLNIPAVMASGHYVKIKDHKGRAILSSGSRHAWTKVFDPSELSKQGDHWHVVDATPKGAPEMDEEEMDEESRDEVLEGDFGEVESEIIPEEEIRKMIEETKKIIKKQKEKEKNPEEIKALNFAKKAECSVAEAKRIFAQIEKAQAIKDSKGRNILDLLSREFMKIVRENVKEVPSYRAPVRLSEGDELEEPVEAYIDIKAGEVDPMGFKKFEKKEERVQEYGGFDVFLVCDKSGSMTESNPESGEVKWKEQQRFVYLIAEALHVFAQKCKANRIRLLNPIDVRTCIITFQAGRHDIILPLSEVWGPKEQYNLWKKLGVNIGGGTPDHFGLNAAKKVISEDIEKQKGRRKKMLEKRLRLVIVTADGGSDSVENVQLALGRLRDENTIVEGVGLTNAARRIEATYYPNGKCLESVAKAPEWVAGKIINQVQKLYPKKIKK